MVGVEHLLQLELQITQAPAESPYPGIQVVQMPPVMQERQVEGQATQTPPDS